MARPDSNKVFLVRIFSDDSSYPDISGDLVPDDSFRIVHHAALPEKIPGNADIAILRIRRENIATAFEWARKFLSELPFKIALVSEKIQIKSAIQLVHAGFSEIFELPGDREILNEWILAQYEEKMHRTNTRKKKPLYTTKIIGKSPEICKIRDLISQAASYSDVTVLIQGETGTGKELVARSIHEQSDRSDGPFIEVNCSAIPETLIESEMLGYEKGAFTDARHPKKGFFELAHGGTLFLDEIGTMPLQLQNKILKVVEEKTFRRVGGERKIRTDIRVIAGTNVNLEEAVSRGKFRPDLYYRLKVFTIFIPPLRKRRSDIPHLAEYFLKAVSKRYNTKISGFHPSTLEILKSGAWPGNVRELKHTVERAVVLARSGRILPNHLPVEFKKINQPVTLPDPKSFSDKDVITIPCPESGISMEAIERIVIRQVLEKFNGNQSRAARFLKISRSRLIRKSPGK